MSLSMTLTTAAMWVSARPIRLALARDDYLETLDPGRRPADPPARLRRSGRVVVSREGGQPVYRYEPAARTPGLELMYLPGGGLVNPLVAEHWWIVERLARATGAAITVVCYPLAPEHRADDTLAVIDAQYDRLAARAGTSRLLVAGDSAGGAVAVGLALRAARRPDGLVLFSPWLDLALADPGIARRVSRDPSLRVPGLRAGAEAWVGDRGLDDPALNPVRMELAGLPPTLVFQGGRDIFFDDAVAFARRARAERAFVRLETAPAGFHVYVGAFWTPEARAAYALVGAFSRDPERSMT
ncbi:alpha/beta hydrolase fold domain-containing protein [Microbacterium testaceum]|uniref:alpha/beta hydrolase fold domain-containing protein n=1 Tax=Microbacterium testaceum TaxID=2033 RepID=UPI0037FC81FC